MRELLIRIRNLKKNKNAWEYRIEDCLEVNLCDGGIMFMIMKDGFQINRSTRKKDSRGVEIFENDIVRSKWRHCGVTNWEFNSIGAVLYNHKRSAFRIYLDEHLHRPLHSKKNEKLISIEVIGNIYDNEDLLKFKMGE